jgi:hypothetical protein
MQKNPILEAKRYMQNAREILSEKAGKDGDLYSDPKYVQMAGNTAWNGVLLALDACLGVKKAKGIRKRVAIKDYLDAIGKKDKKMSRYLNSAYESIHLFLGYDGNLNYKMAQAALEQGDKIIDWSKKHYQPK